jgi:hypothetical protein
LEKIKYPEAESNYNKYNSIKSELIFLLNSIEYEISCINMDNIKLNLVSNTLEGRYYEEYIKKKDTWFTEIDEIKSIFNDFIEDLSACIERANSKTEEWKNKIGILDMED